MMLHHDHTVWSKHTNKANTNTNTHRTANQHNGHMEHRGLGKYKNKTKQLNIAVDVKKKLSSNAAKTHLVGIRL